MKADEVGALRAQTLDDGFEALCAAAADLRAAFDAGGRLLALGNGGSATDAMDAVADFAGPPAQRGWPARRAIDLTADTRDPHRDRQRHRDRGDLRPPGDRVRSPRRRAAGALHERQLAQRARGAGGGPPSRAARRSRSSATTAVASRPKGWPTTSSSPARSTSRASRRPRRRPITCCAGARGVVTRRASARRGGHRPGRRLSPLRLPAGARGGARRATCSTTSAACCSTSRAPRRRWRAFVARLRGRGAAAGVDRVGGVDAAARRRAIASSGSSTARAGGEPAAPVTADAATCDDVPGRARATPPTAASATRSSTAPTAARASPSSRGVPYDRAADDDGGLRHVRALPGRVRRPGRPPLPRPAQRLPGLRAARCGCGDAGRATTAMRRGRGAAARRRDRRGQGRRRLPPRLPRRRRGAPWRGCARASTARTGRSR